MLKRRTSNETKRHQHPNLFNRLDGSRKIDVWTSYEKADVRRRTSTYRTVHQSLKWIWIAALDFVPSLLRESLTMDAYNEDQKLNCCDCGSTIIFTANQQRFFRKKGFRPPKRCRSCKELKKDFHKGIKNSFERNCVMAPPAGIVRCAWCGNAGHAESSCQWKKEATCRTCGRIGRPTSLGFASGIRTNAVEMGCNCRSR